MKVSIPHKLISLGKELFWSHEINGEIIDLLLVRRDIIIDYVNKGVFAIHPLTCEKVRAISVEEKELSKVSLKTFKYIKKELLIKVLKNQLNKTQELINEFPSSREKHQQKYGRLEVKLIKAQASLARMAPPTERIEE